jgi:hypothetical protein
MPCYASRRTALAASGRIPSRSDFDELTTQAEKAEELSCHYTARGVWRSRLPAPRY